MKQILTALALVAMVGSAQAQHHGHRGFGHHHHHHARGPGWGWVVPAIIGGTVVYAATRPAQAEPQPPVVVVPPAPNGQVILQNTGVVCPQGTAPFFNVRADRYGRTYYEFDTCK